MQSLLDAQLTHAPDDAAHTVLPEKLEQSELPEQVWHLLLGLQMGVAAGQSEFDKHPTHEPSLLQTGFRLEILEHWRLLEQLIQTLTGQIGVRPEQSLFDLQLTQFPDDAQNGVEPEQSEFEVQARHAFNDKSHIGLPVDPWQSLFDVQLTHAPDDIEHTVLSINPEQSVFDVHFWHVFVELLQIGVLTAEQSLFVKQTTHAPEFEHFVKLIVLLLLLLVQSRSFLHAVQLLEIQTGVVPKQSLFDAQLTHAPDDIEHTVLSINPEQSVFDEHLWHVFVELLQIGVLTGQSLFPKQATHAPELAHFDKLELLVLLLQSVSLEHLVQTFVLEQIGVKPEQSLPVTQLRHAPNVEPEVEHTFLSTNRERSAFDKQPWQKLLVQIGRVFFRIN